MTAKTFMFTGCFILFATVFAEEGSITKIKCHKGNVEIRCLPGQCCQVDEADIQAGGYSCGALVEKEMRRNGLVRCFEVKDCDTEMNPMDIRVGTENRVTATRAGEAVTLTGKAYSIRRLLNSTWTHNGSLLGSTHRITSRTRSVNDTLPLCQGAQKIVGMEANLSISDVVIGDAGVYSHTACSSVRCVTTNFTLTVHVEQESTASLVPRVVMFLVVFGLLALACMGAKCRH